MDPNIIAIEWFPTVESAELAEKQRTDEEKLKSEQKRSKYCVLRYLDETQGSDDDGDASPVDLSVEQVLLNVLKQQSFEIEKLKKDLDQTLIELKVIVWKYPNSKF